MQRDEEGRETTKSTENNASAVGTLRHDPGRAETAQAATSRTEDEKRKKYTQILTNTRKRTNTHQNVANQLKC